MLVNSQENSLSGRKGEIKGKERKGKGGGRGEEVEGDLARPKILAWRPLW